MRSTLVLLRLHYLRFAVARQQATRIQLDKSIHKLRDLNLNCLWITNRLHLICNISSLDQRFFGPIFFMDSKDLHKNHNMLEHQIYSAIAKTHFTTR